MIAENYLTDVIEQFRKQKELAERAIAQVDDEKFFMQLDEESNSIAILMKHLGGNMISRWTDFLTTDGEKPDRHRDTEFVIEAGDTREKIFERWNQGWQRAFDALEALSEDDLNKTVYIRSEPHSVIQAINRQMTHAAYHVGQITFLAKHFAGNEWNTLTIPRGKTEEFLAKMKKEWGGKS